MNEIEVIEESTIFNHNESRLLNKTMDIREKIVDQMASAGLPTKAHELLALNAVMNDMDKQVMDKVKLRVEQEEDDNKNKTVAMVAEILGRIDSNRGYIPMSNKDINLPDKYLPNDIVPGETDISPDKLSLADFVKGEDYEFSN